MQLWITWAVSPRPVTWCYSATSPQRKWLQSCVSQCAAKPVWSTLVSHQVFSATVPTRHLMSVRRQAMLRATIRVQGTRRLNAEAIYISAFMKRLDNLTFPSLCPSAMFQRPSWWSRLLRRQRTMALKWSLTLGMEQWSKPRTQLITTCSPVWEHTRYLVAFIIFSWGPILACVGRSGWTSDQGVRDWALAGVLVLSSWTRHFILTALSRNSYKWKRELFKQPDKTLEARGVPCED